MLLDDRQGIQKEAEHPRSDPAPARKRAGSDGDGGGPMGTQRAKNQRTRGPSSDLALQAQPFTEEEEAMKKRARGMGGVYQRGHIWWLYYSFRGRPYRESSSSTKE